MDRSFECYRYIARCELEAYQSLYEKPGSEVGALMMGISS